MKEDDEDNGSTTSEHEQGSSNSSSSSSGGDKETTKMINKPSKTTKTAADMLLDYITRMKERMASQPQLILHDESFYRKIPPSPFEVTRAVIGWSSGEFEEPDTTHILTGGLTRAAKEKRKNAMELMKGIVIDDGDDANFTDEHTSGSKGRTSDSLSSSQSSIMAIPTSSATPISTVTHTRGRGRPKGSTKITANSKNKTVTSPTSPSLQKRNRNDTPLVTLSPSSQLAMSVDIDDVSNSNGGRKKNGKGRSKNKRKSNGRKKRSDDNDSESDEFIDFDDDDEDEYDGNEDDESDDGGEDSVDVGEDDEDGDYVANLRSSKKKRRRIIESDDDDDDDENDGRYEVNKESGNDNSDSNDSIRNTVHKSIKKIHKKRTKSSQLNNVFNESIDAGDGDDSNDIYDDSDDVYEDDDNDIYDDGNGDDDDDDDDEYSTPKKRRRTIPTSPTSISIPTSSLSLSASVSPSSLLSSPSYSSASSSLLLSKSKKGSSGPREGNCGANNKGKNGKEQLAQRYLGNVPSVNSSSSYAFGLKKPAQHIVRHYSQKDGWTPMAKFFVMPSGKSFAFSPNTFELRLVESLYYSGKNAKCCYCEKPSVCKDVDTHLYLCASLSCWKKLCEEHNISII